MTIRILLFIMITIVTAGSGCGDDGPTPPALDNEKPVFGDFIVGSGNVFTISRDVVINSTVSDNSGLGGLQMRCSEDPDFSGVDWVPYDNRLTMTLTSGDGWKQIYGQLRDPSKNISATETAEILLAEHSTIILTEPAALSISSGESGSMSVKIMNAQDMVSGRFQISFDHNLIEVTNLVVDVGTTHILRTTGATIIVPDQDYENATGRITISAIAQQNGFIGVTGDGPFATITFRAKSNIQTPTPISITAHEIYNYPAGNPPEALGDVFLFDGSISE
jgi:hypothetical protein